MSIAETFIEKVVREGWTCKRGQCHQINNWANDYAEGQGYDSPGKGVLLADWNNVTRWDEATKRQVDVCGCMERIVNLAEKLGFSIEWYDEWSICDDCNKALRTSPDHWGWRPAYWMRDSDIRCRECSDDREITADCIGRPNMSLPEWVKPESVGYYPIGGGYESGWHPGQNDTPEVVANRLEDAGVKRFVFVVNDIGQFDVRFDVCVRKRDLKRAKVALGVKA